MKKILLIEDDVVLAQTLARRLGKQGYDVECAGEAENVIAAMTIWKAEIFLVDLRLGADSGLNLISPLRQHYPEATIIVMTGFASIATAVNAIKLGADDYLPKPLDFKLLLDTIEGRKPTTFESPQETMSPDRIEWEHIQSVLTKNDGNVSATARELGMYRRTLQRKLAKRPVNQ